MWDSLKQLIQRQYRQIIKKFAFIVLHNSLRLNDVQDMIAPKHPYVHIFLILNKQNRLHTCYAKESKLSD